ncbi:MAG TPA: FliH/SctL family protein [Desulfatiglandales bacterium]|nr:FliH/SctL family protein [Desulfatiglandales bacterium]
MSNLKKITETGESWKTFKLETVESPFLIKKRDEVDFVRLETEKKGEGGFILLGKTGDQCQELKEAEKILKKAQEKAVDLEREAYEKGFAQGEKDGFELGEKKALKVIENIENFLIGISRIKKDILKHHEKEILEIIFAIATKIIHYRLDADNKIIKDTVFEALNLTVERSKITLKVNPNDLDYVERFRPEMFAKFKELKSIMVTSDPSITRGGCFLETPYGDVDARVETEMEKIHQCLEEAFNSK